MKEDSSLDGQKFPHRVCRSRVIFCCYFMMLPGALWIKSEIHWRFCRRNLKFHRKVVTSILVVIQLKRTGSA